MRFARALTAAHAQGRASILAFVHQPDPTNPSRWDVAPGKHREFSEFCARAAEEPRRG
jgi:hypothetical protein